MKMIIKWNIRRGCFRKATTGEGSLSDDDAVQSLDSMTLAKCTRKEEKRGRYDKRGEGKERVKEGGIKEVA